MADEVKAKISKANTGKVRSAESRLKQSAWWKEHGPRGESHPRFGSTTSEDTRKKQSEAKLGENHWAYGTGGPTHYNYGRAHTEETKVKLSKALTGIKRSDETRSKMSAAQTGANNPHYGKAPHNKGVPMSVEQKAHLSALTKGRPNKGRHTRWHTNRGTIDPTCTFCTDD